MLLLATISWLEILIVVAVGWLVLGVIRRTFRWSIRMPLTLIAVAAIVGGLLVFTRKSNEHDDRWHDPSVERMPQIGYHEDLHDRIHDQVTRRVEKHVEDLERRLENLPEIQIGGDSHRQWVAVKPSHDRNAHDYDTVVAQAFPFDEHRGEHVERKGGMSRVGLIALGAVLVICGWLLFNRDRGRPVALKAVTVLGLAATGVILFGLFEAPSHRRIARSRDRVVRVSADTETPAVRVEPRSDDRSPPSHAKRPVARARRPVPRDVDELPPRAGEIPVAEELGHDEPQADKPDEPKPADAAEQESAEESAEEPSAEPEADVTEVAASEAETEDEPTTNDSDKPGTEDEDQTVSREAANQDADADEDTDKDVDEGIEEENVAVARSDTIQDDRPDEGLAAERPDWIEMPGQLVDSVYRVSIKSGLYADVPECQGALDQTIKQYVDDYIERLMGEGTSALVDIDREYLNQHIKQAEFSEIVISESVGPMHEIHALLEIDDTDRAVFHERWRRAEVTHRLWYVGSAAIVVLALLSTFYGYLKLDSQTGGAHKSRLQLAATLVALIVAAGALLAFGDVTF